MIACSKEIDLDSFYDNCVETNVMDVVEQYGYFIIHFTFDETAYIKDNHTTLEKEFNNLKHLLD